MGDLLALLVILAVACFIIYFLTNILVKRFVVPAHEVALLYCNGKFARRLDPGVYWRFNLFRIHKIRFYDMCLAILTLPGQELLSSDNVGIKVSMTISYEVADPVAVDNSVQDYQGTLYSSVQLALRSAVGKRTIEQLLESRDGIGKEILEEVVREMGPVGLRVHFTEMKDIMFSGDLKRIFSEVVKAKKEAQALLEKARGETAALRSLANAANLLKNNPELLDLKVLQTIAQTSLNTYVLGVPQGIVPIPKRPQEPIDRPTE